MPRVLNYRYLLYEMSHIPSLYSQYLNLIPGDFHILINYFMFLVSQPAPVASYTTADIHFAPSFPPPLLHYYSGRCVRQNNEVPFFPYKLIQALDSCFSPFLKWVPPGVLKVPPVTVPSHATRTSRVPVDPPTVLLTIRALGFPFFVV